ncbi:MAG: gamma carbonic anhydrase family protein [Sphingomonas bacterium]|jgi:carbonic anhydrase/acetyltransferase-like protein (isoleucine patch superfamily)|nr:gamma carbonic anhydrase family protein [Sphingomonas bacterium]
MARYEIDGIAPQYPDDGSAWIAPGAHVVGDARLGREVSIWFGAVVRADNTPILIGERTNIQEGAMLHSDPDVPLTIGAGCTIGHRAILHGCTLGANVLIGMGAIVLNHAVIGDNCLVGAGALVTEGKVFPPNSLIVGSPARVVRPLDDAAVERLRISAIDYAARARTYATGLRAID